MRRAPALLIITLLATTALITTASAAEKTLILSEPTAAAPLTYTQSTGAAIIEQTSGKTFKCNASAGSGSFTTANLGSGSILFTGCTSSLETVCTGVGDATGDIEQKGELHFVLGLEMLTSTTSTLRPVLALLVTQFHFTCKNTEGTELLVLFKGCLAGVQDGGEGLLSSFSVLFEEFTKGENKVLSILMENNTKAETKCLLEQSISAEKTGETFELASISNTAGDLSAGFTGFKKSGAAVTVLLMDK